MRARGSHQQLQVPQPPTDGVAQRCARAMHSQEAHIRSSCHAPAGSCSSGGHGSHQQLVLRWAAGCCQPAAAPSSVDGAATQQGQRTSNRLLLLQSDDNYALATPCTGSGRADESTTSNKTVANSPQAALARTVAICRGVKRAAPPHRAQRLQRCNLHARFSCQQRVHAPRQCASTLLRVQRSGSEVGGHQAAATRGVGADAGALRGEGTRKCGIRVVMCRLSASASRCAHLQAQSVADAANQEGEGVASGRCGGGVAASQGGQQLHVLCG